MFYSDLINEGVFFFFPGRDIKRPAKCELQATLIIGRHRDIGVHCKGDG